MKTKPQETVLTFDPKRMRYDKHNPKVIYDSTRKLDESAATTRGYLYIGVKDKPSALEIKDTIMHEKSHIGHKVAKSYLQAAQQELQAYDREKAKSSAQRWNRVLPMHIKDFLPSLSYLSKREQTMIKSRAKKTLSPLADGGNEWETELALRKLGKFWLEEEPRMAMQIVYHGTDKATARKILKDGFKPGTYFATHLEDAIGFGGTHIFEVAVESVKIPKASDWQFIASDRVPPSQIVELKHYPKAKAIVQNKALGDAVFRSNFSTVELQQRLSATREPRGKVLPRVGYTDKSRKRLSRIYRKGWRRTQFR